MPLYPALSGGFRRAGRQKASSDLPGTYPAHPALPLAFALLKGTSPTWPQHGACPALPSPHGKLGAKRPKALLKASCPLWPGTLAGHIAEGKLGPCPKAQGLSPGKRPPSSSPRPARRRSLPFPRRRCPSQASPASLTFRSKGVEAPTAEERPPQGPPSGGLF